MTTDRTNEPRQYAPADVPILPALGPDVSIMSPDGGQSWIVKAGESRYLRVSSVLAPLVLAVDGKRTLTELVGKLGEPWTEKTVRLGLSQMMSMGLLEGSGTPQRPPARLRYIPPLTLQLSTRRPTLMFDRLEPWLQRAGVPIWRAFLVLLALGAVALLLQAAQLGHSLSQPVPLSGMLVALGLTLLGAMAHEFAHGCVLTYYGGRPSRFGFMLFYLMPALFCDVSDGWRLPRKEHRVRVALAGICVQLAVAALAVTMPQG